MSVYESLNPTTQGVEQRGDHEGGGHDSEGGFLARENDEDLCNMMMSPKYIMAKVELADVGE